jgi:hypothetical protein
MNRLPIRLLSTALLVAFACATGSAESTPGYLHVIVERLPQCDYGIGYEQPLRVDLILGNDIVATQFHSGIYTGEESLKVALHAPEAVAGRYTIRFGRCPSLIDDPLGSVACEDPDWVRRTRVRLTPAGIDQPQVVEYFRLRAQCLEVPQ